MQSGLSILRSRWGFIAFLALALTELVLASPASAGMTEFTLPTSNSGPYSIAAGPDGALWFTEFYANKIGRISTSGQISEFPIPGARTYSRGITAGPDGALWFAAPAVANDRIGRITTTGSFSEFTNPARDLGYPLGITPGPDGALWFTELNGNKIGRMTTTGSIDEFRIPTEFSSPWGIIAGPDGALWFAEESAFANKIGRVTTNGAISEFPIPTPNSSTYYIAAGPDGALWFTETEQPANKVGRITTAGSISEFRVPTASSRPGAITAGPDGALWFVEQGMDRIGRITTGGRFSEFRIPTIGASAIGITVGSDGAIWFTEFQGNKIGRITVPPSPVPESAPLVDAPLVPTFVQCGGPGYPPNAEHAPPSLTGGPGPDQSCDSPRPTASEARVGEQSIGSARFSVMPGDVAIDIGTNDVQTVAGTPYDPTPGSSGSDLTAAIRLRITDYSSCTLSPCNGPYDIPATASDIDFSLSLDCEMDGTLQGSTCQAHTTADAVVPGAFSAGSQTVVEVFRIRLLDETNTLFEQQGLFAP